MGINKSPIMKNIFVIIFCILSIQTWAQVPEQPSANGQIIYERSVDWIKLLSRASHLSKEEKDRIGQTWKNETSNKINMVLTLSENKSHYTHENEQQFSEDGTYSWSQDTYIISRDFEKNSAYELQKMLGKNYIIEDTLRPLNWKILNEIKEVAGYICMKASTFDPIKKVNIIAWFCTDIPISAGPEQYFGLPGLILEINVDSDAVLLTATKVNLKKDQTLPSFPKKPKGKKINFETYNNLITDYIVQSEKMHEFTWNLRY
jgi:GLPGLI family protein